MDNLNKYTSPSKVQYPNGRYSWLRVLSGSNDNQFGEGIADQTAIKMFGDIDMNTYKILNSGGGGGGGGGTPKYAYYAIESSATTITPGGAGNHETIINPTGTPISFSSPEFTVGANSIQYVGTDPLNNTLVEVSIGVTGVSGGGGAVDVWTAMYLDGVNVAPNYRPTAEIEAVGLSDRITGQWLISWLSNQSMNIYIGDNSSDSLNLLVYDLQISITANVSSGGGGGSGNAIVNDGNSFGTAITIGSNDNQNVNLEVNNSNRLSLNTNGSSVYKNTSVVQLQSDSNFVFQNTSGLQNALVVNPVLNTVRVDSANFLLTTLPDSQTSKILYWNPLSGNVTTGDLPTTNTNILQGGNPTNDTISFGPLLQGKGSWEDTHNFIGSGGRSLFKFRQIIYGSGPEVQQAWQQLQPDTYQFIYNCLEPTVGGVVGTHFNMGAGNTNLSPEAKGGNIGFSGGACYTTPSVSLLNPANWGDIIFDVGNYGANGRRMLFNGARHGVLEINPGIGSGTSPPYETICTQDQDIPNVKYVKDNFEPIGGAGAKFNGYFSGNAVSSGNTLSDWVFVAGVIQLGTYTGWTFNGFNNKITYTGTATQNFQFNWTAVMPNNSQDYKFEFVWYKNDDNDINPTVVQIPYSRVVCQMQNQVDYTGSVSGSFMLGMNQNDTMRLFVRNTGALGQNIIIDTLNMVITKY